MPSIEDLHEERENLKDEIAILEIKLKRVNKDIQNALAKSPGEAYTLPDGREIKVVRGFNRSYDWDSLQSELPSHLWEQILEPNKARLDELIESGVISPKVVAKHATKTERKPFVREFGEGDEA